MALWTYEQAVTDLVLDASDSSTITIATGVSEWRDNSGNSRTVSQATTTAQPSVITAGINGLDLVRFDGGDFLSGGDILDLLTEGMTTFVVGKFANTSDACFFGKTLYAADQGRYSLAKLSGSLVSALDLPSGVNNNASVANSSTAYNLFGTKIDRAGTNKLYLNGTQRASATFTADSVSRNNTRRFLVGAYPNSTDTGIQFYLNGDIAIIILVRRPLSDEERWRFEGFLAHRYGLTSLLASDHLYKTDAPTIEDATASIDAIVSRPYADIQAVLPINLDISGSVTRPYADIQASVILQSNIDATIIRAKGNSSAIVLLAGPINGRITRPQCSISIGNAINARVNRPFCEITLQHTVNSFVNAKVKRPFCNISTLRTFLGTVEGTIIRPYSGIILNNAFGDIDGTIKRPIARIAIDAGDIEYQLLRYAERTFIPKEEYAGNLPQVYCEILVNSGSPQEILCFSR